MESSATPSNADARELQKFSASASQWWDPAGDMAALHCINPLRLDWIESLGKLKDKEVVDVGCGGGILSESIAARGARVLGIDLAEEALQVARLHSLESAVAVDYRVISAEQLAIERPAAFDLVTCLEMLEHVPEPDAVVRACAQLVKPGGQVIFSTFNRNLKSFLLGIIGAEYLLRLVPRGTHRYDRFIRPSELASWCRAAGLEPQQSTGLHYNPLLNRYRLGSNTDVSYFLACRRTLSSAGAN